MCFQSQPKSAYGYPVVSAKRAGVQDYFSANPQVAGMAWGGGENGSDPSLPRSIVVNDSNEYMRDPVRRDALMKVEAARHLMSQNNYSPDFPITPQQQDWRKGMGAYASDDNALRQSIISRLIVGDNVPGVTPQQQSAADNFNQTYFPQAR